MNNNYYTLDFSKTIFRYLVRKMYEDVVMSNEDIDEIRLDFIEYLKNKNFTELQQKNCLPKNEADVILNMDNPLRIFGFPPAFILHFTNYVEEQTKLIKENNEKT